MTKIIAGLLLTAASHICQAQVQSISGAVGFATINGLVDRIESDYIDAIKEDVLLAPCLAALAITTDARLDARSAIRDALAKLPHAEVGLAVGLCGRGIASALGQSPPAYLGPNRVRAMLGMQPPGSVGLTVDVGT